MSGYSGTPLAKKLGIGEASRVLAIRTPDSVIKEIQSQAPTTKLIKSARAKASIDVALVMCTTEKHVVTDIPKAHRLITQSGCIWACWPKKSSGAETEISENWIRDAILKTGLVDVKVCAINETWSGLKFVIRIKDRKP